MNTPLTEQAIRDQAFEIIARQARLDVASLRPEATLKELGVSSLEAIQVIFDIEQHFDIVFSEDNVDFATDTVGSLLDAVREALAVGSGAPEAAA